MWLVFSNQCKSTSSNSEQWSHEAWGWGSGVKVYIGAMVPWGFEDLRIWGQRFKAWWNCDQNMMKLRSKHGEIHILCTTTFCTPSVPNNGYIGYIVSFVPSFWVHIFSSNENALLLSCDMYRAITEFEEYRWANEI